MSRPDVRPPADWSFPVARRTTLPNGLAVLAFDRPGQYVVSVGLALDLPLTAEGATEGVATLVLRCLDEGTRTHPGLAFTEALEAQGAAFTGTAGYSATQLYLDVPASRLAAVLPLLAEAVTEPLLDDADVDRHRTLRLAEIEQSLAHPAQRATLEFRRALIDQRFRASRPVGGEATSVAAVSADAARDFHAHHYSPVGATLVVAGDFAADPLALVASAFADWRPTEVAVEHERPAAAAARVLLIDRPGSVQADVRLGGFGVDRHDPRWPALQLASYALGGAFLSRLNRVLREEKGYTYGVHLTAQPFRNGGLLSLQGSFRTEVASAAIADSLALLNVSTKPFTSTEITDARNYAIGVGPLRYSTASGVTEQVVTLAAAGLGPEYVDEHAAALARVTPEHATAAAAELLHPSGLTLVVVGRADVLEPDLTDRGLAVEVVC